MGKCYVYVHKKLTDGLPFYVGKGSGKRAFATDKKSRNRLWRKIFKEHGLVVDFLSESLSEKTAYKLEKEHIFKLRHFGIKLANFTDGGEGCPGFKITDQYRLKMSESLSKNTKKIKKAPPKRPKSFGINNHFSDKNLYYFTRLSDKLIIKTTRSDLISTFDLSRDQIKKLFYKDPIKRRVSANGWRLSDKKEMFKHEQTKNQS